MSLDRYYKQVNEGSEPFGDLGHNSHPRPSAAEARVLYINAIMHIGDRSGDTF